MRKALSIMAVLVISLTAFGQTFSFCLDGKKVEYPVKNSSWMVSGIKVECQQCLYPEYDVKEWVIRFTNTSKKNSPTISDLKVMTDYAPGANWSLHHMNGTSFTAEDFMTYTKTVGSDPTVLNPSEHRSSSNAFPFFRLTSENLVKIYAIGWTGYWQSSFQIVKGKLQTVISSPYLESYLEPGESIRTARIAAMTCNTTDERYAQNRFKRFMRNCHHPKGPDGTPAHYPLSSSFDYGDPAPNTEYGAMTSEWGIALVHRYKMYELLPEYFWLDAGWYPGGGDWKNGNDWSSTVGNWEYDKERFPNGLSELADTVRAVGCKFILWFEPERGRIGTKWVSEHPDYYMREAGQDFQFHIDFTKPEALDFVCKEVDRMIKEYHVDLYRQDSNITPDPYYDLKDPEGRKGITESHYVEGLYKFWDYLLEHNPGLLIDNCASGGNRLDMETFSRSAPIWRSDYCGDPHSNQVQTYGLAQWVPCHGTGVYDSDLYSCRSGYSSALIFNWQISGWGDLPAMQRIMAEYRQIKPYYEEDFYPLTDENFNHDHAHWLAYQLNNPNTNDGYIVAFRREECPQNECTVKLGGLDPQSTYSLENKDNGEVIEMSGAQLAEGLSIILNEPRQSVIFKYCLK